MDEKISLKDVVNLALKGYSKDDIKELFALAKQTEKDLSGDGEQKAAATDEPKVEPEQKAPEVEPESKPSNIETTDTIEELKKQIIDLKGQLTNAQKSNVSEPLPDNGKDDDESILKDLARSFM